MNAKATARGRCRVCGSLFAVTSRGNVWNHWPSISGGSRQDGRCAGSGLRPMPRSIDLALADAEQHELDHPTHGIDCYCMDALVLEVRELSAVPGGDQVPLGGPGVAATGGTAYKAQRRIDLILTRAARRTYR